MMFSQQRRDCAHCEKLATVELNGRFYCGEHALDKLRQTNEIPPMRLVKQ